MMTVIVNSMANSHIRYVAPQQSPVYPPILCFIHDRIHKKINIGAKAAHTAKCERQYNGTSGKMPNTIWNNILPADIGMYVTLFFELSGRA